MALIEVRNLTKVYHTDSVATRAVDGVNASVQDGEFLAIMGPSGSGKSTLLHILGFLDRLTAGEYFFEGTSTAHYSDDERAKIRNRSIGFVFQAFNLLPRTSVFENVKLPLLYSDMPENRWNDMTRNAIELVGLTHRAHHEPSQLSGGEKQRAAIARALVMQPAVILADEPTGNLDSKSGNQVMEAISRLHHDGHTIVLITHEIYTAEYADRVIHVKDGTIEKEERITKSRDEQKHDLRK